MAANNLHPVFAGIFAAHYPALFDNKPLEQIARDLGPAEEAALAGLDPEDDVDDEGQIDAAPVTCGMCAGTGRRHLGATCTNCAGSGEVWE